MNRAQIISTFQFFGGSDASILQKCRPGVRMMKTMQGGLCLLIACVSAIFAANTWGTIYHAFVVGIGVYIIWTLLIGGVNWMIGYARDRPVKNLLKGLVAILAALIFYASITSVNLMFTLMQVYSPEVSNLQEQQRASLFVPLQAKLDIAVQIREAAIKMHQGVLQQYRSVYDAAVRANQERVNLELATARRAHDTLSNQLNAKVESLQTQLQDANRRRSAEVAGQVLKSGQTRSTTGRPGEGQASAAVQGEITNLERLLADANKDRDEKIPVSLKGIEDLRQKLFADQKTSDAAFATTFSQQEKGVAQAIEEVRRVYGVAEEIYKREVTDLRKVTQDGIKTRFNALRAVLQDDPWSMAPFVLLIFFLETLPFWFTFMPMKEYRQRIELEDAEVDIELETQRKRMGMNHTPGTQLVRR